MNPPSPGVVEGETVGADEPHVGCELRGAVVRVELAPHRAQVHGPRHDLRTEGETDSQMSDSCFYSVCGEEKTYIEEDKKRGGKWKRTHVILESQSG